MACGKLRSRAQLLLGTTEGQLWFPRCYLFNCLSAILPVCMSVYLLIGVSLPVESSCVYLNQINCERGGDNTQLRLAANLFNRVEIWHLCFETRCGCVTTLDHFQKSFGYIPNQGIFFPKLYPCISIWSCSSASAG